ncbi:peptidylprolyl isomerase [Candidatus Sneabacter namystus]|uniref:Parvulin-like PPIase n=1 Tax=Candidatus Sneabacter namystus TaxID=2601646 RepID=A0A5C0UK59_9RICK|nr:peptidylprolyl isomerase [Candidatus Sneabacter namystus]QEK39822.1 hypothetical protein FZC37_02710 [Candidatus Sneabacter namystus]
MMLLNRVFVFYAIVFGFFSAYAKDQSVGLDIVATYKNKQITERQLLDFYDLWSRKASDTQMKPFFDLPKEWRQHIIREYVKSLVLEDAAKESKIEKSPEYKKAFDTYSKMFLMEFFLDKKVNECVTDAVVENEYNSFVKNLKEKGEAKIIVLRFPTKLDASAFLQKIKAGGKFNDMVKALPEGSKFADDARYFRPGDLNSELENVIFSLNVGECSGVTHIGSEFFLVKIIDKRQVADIPSLGQVGLALRNKLKAREGEQVVDSLMKQAQVRIFVR